MDYPLAVSACWGFHLWKRLGTNRWSKLGVGQVVGSTKKPTWSETLIGFSSPYHHLNEGELVLDKAVQAMKVASRHPGFACIDGEGAKHELRLTKHAGAILAFGKSTPRKSR